MTVSTFRCTIDSEQTARRVYRRRHRVPPALSNNVFAVWGERPFSHTSNGQKQKHNLQRTRVIPWYVRKRSVHTTRVVFFFFCSVRFPANSRRICIAYDHNNNDLFLMAPCGVCARKKRKSCELCRTRRRLKRNHITVSPPDQTVFAVIYLSSIIRCFSVCPYTFWY